MSDFQSDVRVELLRVQPGFTEAEADDLINNIGEAYDQIRADDEAHEDSEWADFYDFSHFKDTAVATVYRQETIEVFVFRAGELIIQQSQSFAMTDVADFLELIWTKFNAKQTGLTFPITAISKFPR